MKPFTRKLTSQCMGEYPCSNHEDPLVDLSLAEDGISALGKAHMRSTPSLSLSLSLSQKFPPNVAFGTVPTFV